MAPLSSDFNSLTARLFGFNRGRPHGETRFEEIVNRAPDVSVVSARISPNVVIYEPRQVLALTRAIRDFADNPKVQIIGTSIQYPNIFPTRGTLLQFMAPVKEAIRYAHSKGKMVFFWE